MTDDPSLTVPWSCIVDQPAGDLASRSCGFEDIPVEQVGGGDAILVRASSASCICPRHTSFPLALFAAGRAPSVQIFGNDYPTPDGTCIRDYVHVSDLASAHVAALDWLAKGNPSQSINLGNGRGFSVAEVVRTAEKVTGRSVKAEICARRAGDPPVLVSDSSKARELLGWTPRYPELDQQIAHAWAWFRDKMPNP